MPRPVALAAQTPQRYLPHLDGLRGIAILLVVGYHAEVPGFDNGFFGVDVFFVLSGFLIFRLLLGHMTPEGRVPWRTFYGRRARRLVPAAVVMSLFVLAVAALLTSPTGERQAVSKSVLAATASLSNVWFWEFAETNYFTSSSSASTLMLHTWSLGIEEQFYLLLGPGIVVCAWLARRTGLSPKTTVRAALWAGVAASLATAIWLTRDHQAAAFYSLPSRAFELGAGALLAVHTADERVRGRSAAALAGIGVALLSTTLLLEIPRDGLPGWWTLLPVAAAGALIVAGSSGPIAALLQHRALVGLGLVSYGLYLWHWPLMVTADIVNIGPPPWAVQAAVGVLAVLPAYASYRWLEQPFRRRRSAISWSGLTAYGAALASVAAIAGGVGLHAKLAEPSDRWAQRAALETDYPALPQICSAEDPALIMGKTGEPCALRAADDDDAPLVLVWGDSHAWALTPAVLNATANAGAEVVDLSEPGCAPADPTVPMEIGAENEAFAAACRKANAALFAEVEAARADERQVVVVAAARWPIHLGAAPLSLVDLAAADAFETIRLRTPAEAVVAFRSAMTRLRAAGAQTVLASPVPELRRAAPACLSAPLYSPPCDTARPQAIRQVADAEAMLRRVASDFAAEYVDLAPSLCDLEACRAQSGGVVRYFDDDHLSATFSRTLAPLFRTAVERTLDRA